MSKKPMAHGVVKPCIIARIKDDADNNARISLIQTNGRQRLGSCEQKIAHKINERIVTKTRTRLTPTPTQKTGVAAVAYRIQAVTAMATPARSDKPKVVQSQIKHQLKIQLLGGGGGGSSGGGGGSGQAATVISFSNDASSQPDGPETLTLTVQVPGV